MTKKYFGECSICGEDKELPKNSPNGRICAKCYREKVQPKKICSGCGLLKIIHKSDTNVCLKCYKKTYNPPLHICSICQKSCISNKITKDGAVCLSCYDKFLKPKRKCFLCNKNRIVKKIINNNPICGTCYSKKYAPKVLCIECNILSKVSKIIDGSPICRDCYNKNHYPKNKCCHCGILKKIATNKGGPTCYNCYYKDKRNNDQTFLILTRLRDNVRSSIIKYSKTGKIKKSKDYGINYEEIIYHLGVCPGNTEDYHIDHILPLSAFDFNNPTHIRAAFAPENHQWLLANENLKKGNKYNKEQFKNYIKSFEETR